MSNTSTTDKGKVNKAVLGQNPSGLLTYTADGRMMAIISDDGRKVEFCASYFGRETMRRYHHIGIPTNESKPGETHLKHLKLFVVSHQKSEFGVEWMRFEADAAVPDLVRRVPHVAFEVTDLSSELAGREILIPPNSPSDGVRVAFIVENGAPIELLEFTDPKHPARLSNQMDAKRANRNVWSAALSQAKNEGDRMVCANVFGLCGAQAPGLDGMRCALVLLS